MTQIEAEKEVALAHCSYLETTRTRFEEFRKSIFVDKTRLLSDKIVKFQLKSIDFISSEHKDMISSKEVRKNEKMSIAAFKTLLIAKDNSGKLDYVLERDITSYNYLFDGSAMTRVNKSQLICVLKDYLLPSNYALDVKGQHISVFVDFMSFARCHLTMQAPDTTFEMLVTQIISAILRKHCGRIIHLVFDSYVELSLKGNERKQREKQGAIYLSKIDRNTPVPQQMDKFWSSNRNKVLFPQFVKEILMELGRSEEITVVASGVVDDVYVSAAIYKSDKKTHS